MSAQNVQNTKKMWMVRLLVVMGMLGFAAPGAAQTSQSFTCEIPVAGAASVRAAFEEYYTCTESVFDEWLRMYPAEVAQLQQLYRAWQSGRGHDFRAKPQAARWVREYPVNFSDRRVELSSAQVRALAPTQSGEPVQVAGGFERLFVDRDNRRLFLTSEEEGLVSIRIAERYAYQLEGKVGQSGARDFFVYDKNTALVEEKNPKGGNRDLVVLDISDRANPREVSRLRGVLPEMSGSNAYFSRLMFESPPTFDQYWRILEGKMHSSCGAAPTVSTYPGVHCRMDGTCYKVEQRTNAEEGICTRVVEPEVVARPGVRRPSLARGGPSIAMRDEGTWEQEARSVEQPRLPTRPSPAPAASSSGAKRERAAAVDHAADAPEGGAGGAGSLSQMMVYGSNLYVLSAAAGQREGWLTTFDLTNPREPRVRQILALDNGPEALQRHDNLLLVAGRDAVITASLGVEIRPRLLGEFRQNCPVNYDPIVVQGGIGYRTIIVAGRRIGCTSRLEVIDLSQPHQPVLRTTHAVGRPRGLAVLGDRLFVADEHAGVMVFDITDPVTPAVVGTWAMSGVKDLVLSDFDLFAMSGHEIQTFDVAPLYERGVQAKLAWEKIEGIRTVMRASKVVRR